jgi:hypothetical protein
VSGLRAAALLALAEPVKQQPANRPKMEDITNDLRKLLIGYLRNLYFNSDFNRTIEMRSELGGRFGGKP